MPEEEAAGRRVGRPWDEYALIACGAVLLVMLATTAAIEPMRDVSTFLGLSTVASVAYLAALGLVARERLESRRLLTGCLLLAAAWRIPLLLAPPLLSTDIYRYIWDGRIQRLGHNPYVSAPADPALQALHTPVTALTEHADLPTIYPPFAELTFRAIAAVQESVLAFKIALVLAEAALVVLLLRLLSAYGRSRWWVLAYAWHPMPALEVAGSGHLDVLGVALLVGAALALERRQRVVGGIALALAVAVKFLPVVLAPVVIGRLRWRGMLAGGLVLLGLYGWFASGVGGLALGSLGDYARQWRFNGPLFLAIEPWAGLRVALAIPLLGGTLVAWFASRQRHLPTSAAWAWPLAATLLLAPAVYPWYLLWFLPFVLGRTTIPLMLWSLTALLTYAVWAKESAGVGWVLPGWVQPVEYAPLVAAAVWMLWRRVGGGSAAPATWTAD